MAHGFGRPVGPKTWGESAIGWQASRWDAFGSFGTHIATLRDANASGLVSTDISPFGAGLLRPETLGLVSTDISPFGAGLCCAQRL